MQSEQPPRRRFHLSPQSTDATRQDIDDELAMHLALREAEFRVQGMNDIDAREAAQRRFGNVEQARAELSAEALGRARRVRFGEWMSSLKQDAHFGVRALLRERSFSVIALITLILGFGATTAVATVAFRFLVAPLPLPGAERLLTLSQRSKKQDIQLIPSTKVIEAWRSQTSVYERIEVLRPSEGLLREDNNQSTVAVTAVTPGLLEGLQVLPVIGRRFVASDTAAGNPLVGMLPWVVWRDQYARSPTVLGKVLYLDNQSVEIVGVLPPAFDFSAFGGTAPRLWLPYREAKNLQTLSVLAIPKAGVSIKAFEAALTAAQPAPTTGGLRPEMNGLTSNAVPLIKTASGRRSVILVLAMSLGVLLIACVNVAHLLLARGTTRRRELSVRAALGAGRGRIVRQLFTESVVLAAAASVGGLVVATGALRLAEAYRPAAFAALDGLRVDARVLLFSLLLFTVMATLFGLLPAVLGSRASLADVLRGTSRNTSAGRGVQQLRMVLACSEITVSLLLLVGAGLLTRSTWNLYHVPLGYDPTGILSVDVELPAERYGKEDAARAATLELRRRIGALPGVQRVAVAATAPHMLSGCFCDLSVEGQQLPAEPQRKFIQSSTVDSTYFSLLNLRVLQGRPFAVRPASPEVTISETTAHKLWPAGGAVGKRLRLQRDDTLRTVVGVVSDIRTPDGFTVDDRIHVYFRHEENSARLTLVVRVNGNANGSLAAVSRTITQFDASAKLRRLVTAQDMVDKAREQAQFTMIVFAIFAVVALVLASVGLYGVLAYSVEQRRAEIGVRMAMGAPRAAIITSVLRQGSTSTIAGLVIGVVLAVFASRYMNDMLFEVTPSDPATYAGIVALLAGIALLAMVIPARRASRVDPAIVMRGDG